MLLPLLSFETTREALRVDDMEEVRCISAAGEAGSESKVLRRDVVALGVEPAAWTEFERCGSSVLEEFVLDELTSVNLAPCRERGGGGGDFVTDSASLLLKLGLWSATSTES
jgi:hypothetical protein